jgi:phosphate starvation-inducible protein PhoH and related proteins
MLIRRQIGYLIIMQSFIFPFTSAFLKPPSLRNSPFRVIASGLASRKKVRDDDDGTYPRAIAPLYKPKTANQELYAKYLGQSQYPIVLGIGPAGCGKTLLACVSAIQELRRGNIQKIVLTRPTVAVEEEELGFLPGNLHRKMDPWTRPVFDIFLEHYQQKDLDTMLYSGVIEVCPLAYMRGRTFKRTFIIADEMQNSTPNQMLMLTTRIGDNSKMVITGDLNQSDRSMDNGLLDLMKKIVAHKSEGLGIQMVEMDNTDILRSPIVSQILKIYGVDVGSSTR